MRSTVSDSSGNPENRENPEYGEERYGAVPVREWVGPDGAGRVTDAWAEAGERAAAGEAPQMPAPAGFDGVVGSGGSAGPGGFDGADGFGRPAGSGSPFASAPSAVSAASGSDAWSAPEPAGALAPAGPDPVYPAGADPGPEAVPRTPAPDPAGVPGPFAVTGSGADSVVDLVLDLVPGEDERAGSAFGATSASVSVPAAPGSVPTVVPGAEPAASDPVPRTAGPGPVYRKADERVAGGPQPRDARPNAVDLLPVPAPEAGASAAGDPVDGGPASAVEAAVLVMAGAGSATYGPGATAPDVRDASAPDVRDASATDPRDISATDPRDASAAAPGRGGAPHTAPAPGLAPDSLSLTFTGEDTGEFRTGAREDTGEFRTDPREDTAELRPDVRWDTGRHQAVIANERTASIPVHLLFREEAETGADATALPVTVVRRAPGGEQPAGVRRPPVPRSPQVQPSTRPAPVADPRLHERPGPALPGWVAVLTAACGTAAAGGVLWWAGAVPARVLSRIGVGPRPYDGLGTGAWAALALLATVVLFAIGGLSRGRVGYTWVLTLFGRYRGTVRRTGLMWISPLLLRRRVDVRLRHWRSEPLPAMDANGTALRVVVLVVWRVEDTVRATLGVEDHEEYLREQVEAAMARVLSQLPADAFHEDAHTLRNAEAVGDALTRMLKADCEPVGIEVYSAQPTGIEYAPEVAAAMQRRRIAAIDAKHRDSVLTSVVDAVDDTVNRLTARGLVELDDYERKSLVKDLTVAFYTGRSGGDSA